MVKLLIAEKETNLKKMSGAKENIKPLNGTNNQKDGKYYLVRLEMEVEKLNLLINSSERENRLAQIPEEASGKIRNAIGKAQLLLRKRFKQFRELCQDNIENDPDKKETKSTDLQGYWEMMFIQIDDVNALFTEIETLKANNWLVSENDNLDGPLKSNSQKAITPRTKRKNNNKTSPRPKQNNVDDEKVKKEARSRLAAARKQAKLRQQQLRQEEDENNKLDNSVNSSLNSSMNSSFEVLNDSTNKSNNNENEIKGSQDEEASIPKVIINGDDSPKIEINGTTFIETNGISEEVSTKNTPNGVIEGAVDIITTEDESSKTPNGSVSMTNGGIPSEIVG